MQRVLDFVGQDRRLKNGTCNEAGVWSVPHLLLIRWVLICCNNSKCNMHVQSVRLYHDMFVCMCHRRLFLLLLRIEIEFTGFS